MRLTNTRSINTKQKILLTDRYLTYQYLSRIPYGNFNTIKNQINYDIQNIKQIKKSTRFQDGIYKISKGNFTDEDSIKALATSFSFIFNMSKNKKQYEKMLLKLCNMLFGRL